MLLLFAIIATAHALRYGHWTLVEDARIDDIASSIALVLPLKHDDAKMAKLDEIVRDVSNPRSSRYTDYLSIEQLASLTAVAPERLNAVRRWLEEVAGAEEVYGSKTGDVLKARVSRDVAEKLFDVKFDLWRGDNGRLLTRSLKKFTMPNALREHVDVVLGLSDFPLAGARKQQPNKENSSSSVSASAPSISQIDARGSPPMFSVLVEVVCLDGSLPTSLPLCAQDPLAAISVSGLTQSGTRLTQTTTFTASYDGCTAHQQAPMAFHCRVKMPAQYFEPTTNVVATLVFESTKTLTSAANPYMSVATPPVTPQSLRALYGVPQNAEVTNGATQAVAEFEQQYYSDADLRAFFAAFGMPTSNADGVVVIGPNDMSNPGGEADLDIQYIMAMAPQAETTFWSIAANSTVEIDDILKWAVAMSNTTNPPMVTSISYGMTEIHVDEYLGKGYLKRSDKEFMKLAALGLTVIIASGDTGAGDLGAPPMSNPTCNNHLHADWPSQSPYVTSVGSTYITPLTDPACYQNVDCFSNPLGEVGVSVDNGLFWTTGGGFSNITKTAWFQTDAVRSYLKSGASFPPVSMFNAKGRAYPDAVAVGHNLMVVLNGTMTPIDGTSASAPIFAGIITLLNDARLGAGKKPLGLLNPLLYDVLTSNSNALYDVVVGANRCGAYTGGSPGIEVCCKAGYNAVPGYDTVSGVGSIQYANMLPIVLALK